MFTGCKDFKDIDRRTFIVAIGIDASPDNKDELQVTFKAAVANRESSNGGGISDKKSEIYTVKGKSIVDILRLLKTQTFLEPDFAHMKLIVFGHEFIKNHPINELVDFFVRRRDFQNISYTAISTPSSKELLKVDLTEENFAGNGLFMKFGEGAENPYATHRRLYELYHELNTPGISPSMSILELKEGKIIMDRTAILKDGKLAMELGMEQSEIFNMLSRNVALASLTMADDGKYTGIGLNNVSGKITFDKKAEDLTFNVNIKASATVEMPGDKNKNKDELSKEYSKMLTKKVEALLHDFEESKVDPLELQIKYWSRKRDFWFKKEWPEEELSHAKYNVSCDIKVISTGNLD
jgi:spore germination protein KC